MAGFEVGAAGVQFPPSDSNDSNPFCTDAISILSKFSSKSALPILVLLFYVISLFACSQILKVLVERKSPYTSCCCYCCYYQTSSPHLLRLRHDKDTKHLFTNAPEDHNDARNSQESPSKNRKFFTESTGKIEGERRKRRMQPCRKQHKKRIKSKKNPRERFAIHSSSQPVNQARIFLHFIIHIRRRRQRWRSCPPHASCASRRTVVARGGGYPATGVGGGRETLMNKLVELGIETLEHLLSLWAPAMPVRLAMCSSGDYSNNVG